MLMTLTPTPTSSGTTTLTTVQLETVSHIKGKPPTRLFRAKTARLLRQAYRCPTSLARGIDSEREVYSGNPLAAMHALSPALVKAT
jgi:hypothetical protein